MAQRLVARRANATLLPAPRCTARVNPFTGPAVVFACHQPQARTIKSTAVSKGVVSYTMQKLGVGLRMPTYTEEGRLTELNVQDTLAENFGGAFTKLGSRQFKLDDCPDLTGKVGVVTGGSQGIGFGVAYTLLKHNISKLYIISVNKEVFEGAKAVISDELGQDKAARMVWMKCDLVSCPFAPVLTLAEKKQHRATGGGSKK